MSGRIRTMASAVLALSAVTAGAARTAEAARGDGIPGGVRVGGVDVGGLTVSDALDTVRRAWTDVLETSVRITVGGRHEVVTLRSLGVRTDAEERVRDAAALEGVPLVQRLLNAVLGRDIRAAYPVRRVVDERRLDAYLEALRRRVETDPRDSRVDVSRGRAEIVAHVDGFRLATERAKARLLRAIATGQTAVTLPGSTVPARVRGSDHGDILVVRAGDDRLFHYRGDRLVKSYPASVSLDAMTTPAGPYRVVRKRRRAGGVDHAGGGDAAARAPVDDARPAGAAVRGDAPTIRIHGTMDAATPGREPLAGCIRMRTEDVEELFARVAVGTPVFVVRASDGSASAPPTTTREKTTTPDRVDAAQRSRVDV